MHISLYEICGRMPVAPCVTGPAIERLLRQSLEAVEAYRREATAAVRGVPASKQANAPVRITVGASGASRAVRKRLIRPIDLGERRIEISDDDIPF
ncbi:MAG: hypothetical protein V3T83_10130 [Acidobacteriota bacterium]